MLTKLTTASVSLLMLSMGLNAAALKPDKLLPYKTTTNADGSEIVLNLHVFNPEGHKASASKPVIIFFFGGGWLGGRPEQFYPQAKYLSEKGMVAISAEYRVSSRNKTDPKFCLQDANSAMRFLRAHATELGIDPSRVVSSGGSAGGHLAAMVGTEDRLFNDIQDDLSISAKPQLSVQFNPVIDAGPSGYGHKRVKAYWKAFSPILQLSQNTPPTLLMIGDSDALIPVSTINKYKDMAAKVNAPSKVIIYPGQKHGFFNGGEGYTQSIAETETFLTQHGYIK